MQRFYVAVHDSTVSRFERRIVSVRERRITILDGRHLSWSGTGTVLQVTVNEVDGSVLDVCIPRASLM